MDTWLSKEDNLKTSESIPQSINQQTDIRSLIYQLGKAMEREIQIWWDIAALDFYVNNNIVPRGLRLFKRSTYKRQDATLLKKWDQLLDKGSLLLMVFLINEKKKDLTQLDLDITELKAAIRPLVENGEFVELLDKIERRVKDIEASIRENKRKKIIRDQADYATQTQRNWKKDSRQRYVSPSRQKMEYRPQYHKTFRNSPTLQKTHMRNHITNWTHYEPIPNRKQNDRNYDQHRPMQRKQTHREKYDQRPQYIKHSHYTDWQSREYQHQYTPDSRVFPLDRVKGKSTNKDDKDKRDTQPTPTIHAENDFLEKRGRIPPRKFMMEDFRSPDPRKKRTIKETEEENDQQEDPIQLKRRR
ncbi:Hypothetical predicted protein [Pelobates cultripes]|uniref:Uncharacterized protein n=1 Tax=Pelobates cultripes TaxID=61616 RepID=A0AAD1T783_PELCU|nr:Hypothetical predicted protein [Pelobates cultripes]